MKTAQTMAAATLPSSGAWGRGIIDLEGPLTVMVGRLFVIWRAR